MGISTSHLEDSQISGAIDRFAIISSTDSRGNIDYVNDNFCEISGYSREELIGANHRMVNSGFHPPQFFTDLWTTIQAGKIWQGEVQNRKKTGELYWVRAYIIPITDSNGKIVRFMSFRMDITKEKKEHAELEMERVRCIHLGRLTSLGEMASNVAHEINNPLTVIAGSLDMIRQSVATATEAAANPTVANTNLERISRALKQVDRITKIIHGLRRFSRTDDAQERRKVLIKDLLCSVTDLCSERLRSNTVSFTADIPPDAAIHCNTIQIEQVFVNLISNSVDAIRVQPDRWIRIKVLPHPIFVEIEIVDSGIGINKAHVHRLAEPFFTTKEPGKGTGLGLSISRTILQQHGGEITYDEFSPNTRFVIHLPKAPELPHSDAA